MRPGLAAADERYEVRGAVDAWSAGEVIDAPTADALRARFADDRRRARLAFRCLFWFFTVVAGVAAWGFGASFLSMGLLDSSATIPHAIWLAILAIAAGFGTAYALGPLRLRGFGVEEGLATLALGFGIAASVLVLDKADVPGRGVAFAVGIVVAVAASAAAWRWGLAGSGVVAGGGVLVALGSLPAARLTWIVASVVLAIAARRWRAQARRPVAHRRRAEEVYVVALVSLWVTAHPAHDVARVFTELGDWFDPWPHVAGLATGFGWIVVVALPVLLVASGLARRDRLELDLGGLAAVAASASVIDALDLGPLWMVLLACGALLALLTWSLRRALAASPERSWGGFTDRELLGAASETSWLELATTLAAFSPAPRPVQDQPSFQGEGGEFGGGGASAGF